MKQVLLTPAAGKRLIAKAVCGHPAIRAALERGTIVVVAGTTNGYVAEELLALCGQAGDFDRRRFFRGITVPPARSSSRSGRWPDEGRFLGDVVLRQGQWLKGLTLFDVADDLREGDVILKGANAVKLPEKRAAILIAHPQGGTTVVALQAAIGRRVRLILPVGLEKRVHTDLYELAAQVNSPGTEGLRLMPVPGEVVTELEAVAWLTGARAELMAGGGVCGAEGAVWLVIRGTPEQEQQAAELLARLCNEPPFTVE